MSENEKAFKLSRRSEMDTILSVLESRILNRIMQYVHTCMNFCYIYGVQLKGILGIITKMSNKLNAFVT